MTEQTIDPKLEACRAIFDVILMQLKGNLDNLTREQAIWKLQMIKAIVTVEEEDEK